MREDFAAWLSCAASTALAAPRDRLFSAAWAPIASDTMPTRAAAMASERLDTLSCRTFMRFVPNRYADAPVSRANVNKGLRECRVCAVQLRPFCGIAT